MMRKTEFLGKVIIFSAPSGAGKTSIVHHLLKKDLNLSFSISACTRNKRGNEKNGIDYHFLSKDNFIEKIKMNAFIEWEEVYKDHYYGTLRSEIERIWGNHKHVIFDVDVEGGLKLKKYFKDTALAIFIDPPSLKVLKERLINRASETHNSFENRFSKAEKELTYKNSFDHILLNDKLEETCKNAELIISNFLKNK